MVQRIAINSGGGYVPGLNAVIAGAVLAASQLGWEVVGIHDGYDGLIARHNYSDGGLVKLDARIIENVARDAGGMLGVAPRNDPFRVRTITVNDYVEEVDRSNELLEIIRAEKIDAVISIVGGSALIGTHALSVAFRLSQKGLRTVCIPKSVENDVVGTALSFGYNSALSYTVDTLERIRIAARDVHRIAVVEVLGQEAGWLALQSGMAVCADAVLIPEIPYDLSKVAAKLRKDAKTGHGSSLVVVAEGATSIAGGASPTRAYQDAQGQSIRKSLSPLSDPQFSEGAKVIDRSGLAAETIALRLQKLTDEETFPLVLGQLVRGGTPTAIDRQLGLGYGAGAVRALNSGQNGVMVVFQPPDLRFVPLAETINRVRTVPADSEFIQIARALGISLGD